MFNIRKVRSFSNRRIDKSKKTKFIPVTLLAASALLVAGLMPLVGVNSSAAATEPGLVVVVGSVPPTLNPAIANDGGNNLTFTSLAYDSLIYWAPNGDFEPDLATSWKYVGANNQEFVMTLRPNVEFSDGTTLTAQDVVNWIKYAQASGSTAGAYLTAVAAVQATGPLTVQLNFSSPQPNLDLVFSQNYMGGSIIGPAGLADPSSLGTSTDGAGPYELDAAETVTGSSYVYVQNPNYWNSTLVRYSSITLNVIADATSALDAVESGQANFMFDGSPTQANAAKSAGLKVYAVPEGFDGLFISDFKGKLVKALGSEDVREAISYATDRPVLAKALNGPYAIANDESMVPGQSGYDPAYANYYKYNLTKAKKLMAEGGYPHGFVFPMVADPYGAVNTQVQALASELSKIGITVKIHEVANFTEELDEWLAKKYPALVGLYGTQPMSIEETILFPPTALFNPFKNAVAPSILTDTSEANELTGHAASVLYQKVEVTALKEAYEDVFYDPETLYYGQPGKIANVQIGSKYPGSGAPDVAFWSPPQS